MLGGAGVPACRGSRVPRRPVVAGTEARATQGVHVLPRSLSP